MKKSMKAYLKIESLLFFREPLQVLFSFVFPAVMFIFFASAFSGNLEGSEEYFQVYIPGYFTTVIYIVSMFMIGYQMVVDKEAGIYKRLKATPFQLKSIYKAMMIKSMILCTIGGAEILLVAKFMYDVNLTVYWIQFFVAYLIGNIVAVASGFTIFALCNNAKQAITVIIITFYPLMMLGDNAFPLSMLPSTVQKIAPIIDPLYHLNRIFRGAWAGNLLHEGISILYVVSTVLILCFISFRYDKSVDNF